MYRLKNNISMNKYKENITISVSRIEMEICIGTSAIQTFFDPHRQEKRFLWASTHRMQIFGQKRRKLNSLKSPVTMKLLRYLHVGI